jgi:hypothetical protein
MPPQEPSCTFRDVTSIISTLFAQILCRMDVLNRHEHSRTHGMIVELQRDESKDRAGHNNPGEISGITAVIEALEVSGNSGRRLDTFIDLAKLVDLPYLMLNQYETVAEPHPTTFDWAFGGSTYEQLPCHNFLLSRNLERGLLG